jgi:ABC-2 type transport system permease protein
MSNTAAPAPLFGRAPKFFKPGSAIWLMRHHIRTRLRGKPAQGRMVVFVRNIILLAVLAIACLAMGGGVANNLVMLNGNYEYAPYLLKAGIMLTSFMISLLGSSIMSAYSMFTDREDLDLLLASPLPPERILLSRMLQSAYGAAFTALLMGTVAFGYAIIKVDGRLALIYPVLLSFMLIDLAVSFVIARALLLWFGLRRGRTIAMVIGFAILIMGVLSFQLNSIVGTRGGEHALVKFLGPEFKDQISSIIMPVGRLAFGQPLETLLLTAGAIGLFYSVGSYFWGRFASDAAYMAGQAQHVAKTRRPAKVSFGTGIFRTTIVKEWRSMARDPFVLVQVATPLISLVPLCLVMWGLQKSESRFDPAVLNAIMGFLVVQFGGGIAGTLAWTAASIEEAGDLLLSSPAEGTKLFWSKALATAIPSFLFLALTMAFIAANAPVSALLGLGVGTIGLTCTGAVEFLRARPARRAKMTQRPDRSVVSIILGMIFSMIWASATAMVIAGLSLWTLIPMAIGLIAMAFVWATAPKSVVWMARAPKIGAAGGPWKA